MARPRNNSNQFTDLVDAAGSIICFHKLTEHFKRLEGHADTPEEERDNNQYAEGFSMVLTISRWKYERLRKTFPPKDKIVEALDELIKECGGGYETD